MHARRRQRRRSPVTLTPSGLLTRLRRFRCNLPPIDPLPVPLFSEMSKSSDFTERRPVTQFRPSRREPWLQRSTDPSVDGFPSLPLPRRKCLTRAATLAHDGRFLLQISRAFQMQMASRQQLMLSGNSTVERVQRHCLAEAAIRPTDAVINNQGCFVAVFLFLILGNL